MVKTTDTPAAHAVAADAPPGPRGDKAIRTLESLGAELLTLSIPILEDASKAWARITASEAYAVHEDHLREQPKAFNDDGSLTDPKQHDAVQSLGAKLAQTVARLR